jgi:hypothetical protein
MSYSEKVDLIFTRNELNTEVKLKTLEQYQSLLVPSIEQIKQLTYFLNTELQNITRDIFVVRVKCLLSAYWINSMFANKSGVHVQIIEINDYDNKELINLTNKQINF